MSGKKEAVLDLTDQIGKHVQVKFFGGREVRGLLKGYDPLLNIVIDDCVEYMRDAENTNEESCRKLGRVVCRGPAVTSICPMEGFELLDHSPFDE